jgi:predicted Zn-ribbon and HTH transcriptional regulator
MAKVRLVVWGYRCERCGHEWVPRDKDQEPRVCPKCKSPYWARPRKQPNGQQSRKHTDTT